MDEIALNGLTFYGYHGVNPEETTTGQRFGVDLVIWLDASGAVKSDDIGDTVSYARLFKLTREIVEGEPSKLLEHLAGRIMTAVFQVSGRVKRARVTVTKLSPPLKGSTTGTARFSMERDAP